MEILHRYRGAMLGLAAGDALGTTLEFRSPGTFEPITDMVGGGPFGLKPGQWTDDTAMALCLAESLIECSGFDALDQIERYLRWWRDGHLSSTGHCFDIGNTVSDALRRFQETGDPFSGPTDPDTAGNGSLMRLAPVPLAFARDPRNAIQFAGESSRTTHGAPRALDACRYYAGLIVGALQGVGKTELLSPLYCPVSGLWKHEPLDSRVAEIAEGSFREKEPPAIRGGGYVIEALEAALWAFDRTDSFRDGVLLAVNLGDDADTVGAIYGQLAGAYYGVGAIPDEWRAELAKRELLRGYADLLLALAERLPG